MKFENYLLILTSFAGVPIITELLGKLFLTKLDVPTIELFPISYPLSITQLGDIQQCSPIMALPKIILPTVICENFLIVVL